jgi:hypothetical protein
MSNLKKIVITLTILFSLSEAKVLNSVAIIVEDEAITTAEIKATQDNMKISKQKAIDLLIQNSLQKSVSNEVKISEDEIDSKLEQIASINKLTIKKMQKILKKQGMKWYDYRQRIKTEMKKQKFYQINIAPLIPIPGEDQLKLFYKKNKKLFKLPTEIATIEISAKTEDRLQKFFKNNKNQKGITIKEVTHKSSSTEKGLFSMLTSTPINKITKPINTGNKYVTYLIKAKKGIKYLSYKKAKNGVVRAWQEKQRKKATDDYFKKLRTSANIEYIR